MDHLVDVDNNLTMKVIEKLFFFALLSILVFCKFCFFVFVGLVVLVDLGAGVSDHSRREIRKVPLIYCFLVLSRLYDRLTTLSANVGAGYQSLFSSSDDFIGSILAHASCYYCYYYINEHTWTAWRAFILHFILSAFHFCNSLIYYLNGQIFIHVLQLCIK